MSAKRSPSLESFYANSSKEFNNVSASHSSPEKLENNGRQFEDNENFQHDHDLREENTKRNDKSLKEEYMADATITERFVYGKSLSDASYKNNIRTKSQFDKLSLDHDTHDQNVNMKTGSVSSASRNEQSASQSRRNSGDPSYFSYSEEFESDSGTNTPVKSAKKKAVSEPIRKKKIEESRRKFKPQAQKSKLNRTRQEAKSKVSTSDQRETDYVTQRLLSARRLKINDLRNEILDLQRQYKDIEQENKLLKRLHVRHERELLKIEESRGELPEVVKAHTEEVRVMKVLLRKARENNRELEQKLKNKDLELLHMKDEIQRIKNLSESKELLKRNELQQKVKNLEAILKDRETTNMELNRKVELLTKNYKRDVAAEKSRQKDLMSQLQELQNSYSSLQYSLQGKEEQQQKPNSLNDHEATTYSQVLSLITQSPRPSSNESVPSTQMKVNSSSLYNDNYSSGLSVVEGSTKRDVKNKETIKDAEHRKSPNMENTYENKGGNLIGTYPKDFARKPSSSFQVNVSESEPDLSCRIFTEPSKVSEETPNKKSGYNFGATVNETSKIRSLSPDSSLNADRSKKSEVGKSSGTTLNPELKAKLLSKLRDIDISDNNTSLTFSTPGKRFQIHEEPQTKFRTIKQFVDEDEEVLFGSYRPTFRTGNIRSSLSSDGQPSRNLIQNNMLKSVFGSDSNINNKVQTVRPNESQSNFIENSWRQVDNRIKPKAYDEDLQPIMGGFHNSLSTQDTWQGYMPFNISHDRSTTSNRSSINFGDINNSRNS